MFVDLWYILILILIFFLDPFSESSITDKAREVKSKNEIIEKLEKTVEEKSASIASLQTEIELLQVSVFQWKRPNVWFLSKFFIDICLLVSSLGRKKELWMRRSWLGKLMRELVNLRSRSENYNELCLLASQIVVAVVHASLKTLAGRKT